MIPAKTQVNDIEYIVLPEEIPGNLNKNLKTKFRINEFMDNNSKKTPFLYNELLPLFTFYKLLGRFPVRMSKKVTASREWNLLPQEVRGISEMTSFKRACIKYLYEKGYQKGNRVHRLIHKVEGKSTTTITQAIDRGEKITMSQVSGHVLAPFLSTTSLYAAIIQTLFCISAIYLIWKTIPVYGDQVGVLRGFALTEIIIMLAAGVLYASSMWRDAKYLIKYIRLWTEFEDLFKKCTRQELTLGLNIISKIYGVLSIFTALLFSLFTFVHMDLYEHIYILFLTAGFMAATGASFILLWCINCTALARAGRRLADNFQEYSRNGITPYRLYEYRMAWRKLSSLCDELGNVFALTIWILCAHVFLGFTVAGYSTVFFLRRLMLKPLAISVCGNVQCGVLMFIMFHFPGRVPSSVTNGMLQELNKISPLSVNEETWREVDMFIRIIGDHKSEIHVNGFFILNRQLYVSFISTVVTYLLVIVQVEQDTWY